MAMTSPALVRVNFKDADVGVVAPIRNMEFLELAGVRLRRMQESHLEEVRQWRNSDEVSPFMQFQDRISPEMQQSWFASINNDENYYFVISYENENVGVVNIKNIDSNSGTGEIGIFIEGAHQNSLIGVLALFALYDFAFDFLGLMAVYAECREDNTRIVRLADAFGYEVKDCEKTGIIGFRLSKESYRLKGSSLRRSVFKLAGVSDDSI